MLIIFLISSAQGVLVNQQPIQYSSIDILATNCSCSGTNNTCNSTCYCDPSCPSTVKINQKCFQSYIIQNYNIDSTEVKRVETTANNQMCFQSETASSSAISQTSQSQVDAYNFTLYSEALRNIQIPLVTKENYTYNHNKQFQVVKNLNYFFADSNGMCLLRTQIITNSTYRRQMCYSSSLSPSLSGFSNYLTLSNLYIFSVSAQTTGVVSALLYSIVQSSSTDQTDNSAYIKQSTEVLTTISYKTSTQGQFFNGNAGYSAGNLIYGSRGTISSNSAYSSFTNAISNKILSNGYYIMKGDASQNCVSAEAVTTYIQQASVFTTSLQFDPSLYELLVFGKNQQFSCKVNDVNSTISDFIIMMNFPTSSCLMKYPYYSSSDDCLIVTNNVGSYSDGTNTFTTQQVVIYYGEFGMRSQIQYQIQQVTVNLIDSVLTTNWDGWIRLKIKYINVNTKLIDDTSQGNPSFIPQLPSDIFYPIWYSTFGILLNLNFEYDNVERKGSYVQRYQSKNRKITSNRVDWELPSNQIQTAKYTLVSFIPRQLFEQFSKIANIYFVVIGALQIVPVISISGGLPTIYLPLGLILLVSGAKDFYEDYQRKKSDIEENSRKVLIFNGKEFVEGLQQDIRVGHIIKIHQDQVIPADVLLLRSSEPKGLCYIETKSLDGETNLKQKNVKPELMVNLKNDECFGLDECRFILKYQLPQHYLYQFMGEITLSNGNKSPVNFNNFLLRGCIVRNVRYVFGLVAYTGNDTKIMLNSFKAQSKKSKLEVMMQQLIIIIFIIQILLCFTGGLIYAMYLFNQISLFNQNKDQIDYLGISRTMNDYTFAYNLFVRLGNWLLIFTNFVPISLMVTLEMVKFFQGLLIGKDYRLKSPSVQSSNLNEELGQIEHIFSDKTGTLTCNIMEFKQIIIGGCTYGALDSKTLEQNDYIQDEELQSFTQVANVDFRDKRLINAISDVKDPMHHKIVDVLFMITTCHTVLVDYKDGKLLYNASSPDELALLNFARFVGMEFQGIDQDNLIKIKFNDQIFEWQVMEVFEFTSTRKRQSVLVRDKRNDDIWLFSKGADSILLDDSRLSKKELENKEEKLKIEYQLQQCGKNGLRTLVLCRRKIDPKLYLDWNKKYSAASMAIENRDHQMQALQNDIEGNYEILGATAIEDKLQQDVADTIQTIKDAGIKIWVLTGDKIETAINIGYACKLLSNDLLQHIVDEQEEHMVRSKLEEVLRNLKDDDQQALIISGDSLLHALKPDISSKVMQIGDQCKVVLCCRVSPKQKQDVVTLVRTQKPNCCTLAIGDGANDVNMITAAHVGIGLRGVEGQQAARASDYAVAEFRELRRLLFYHGRECYRRNSVLVCYTFYKNILIVLPQFWYGTVSMYSAESLYDTFLYQLFNILYGSIPIIVYGIFDEEHADDVLTENAESNFYIQGIQGILFNHKIFWYWCFSGAWQAAVVSFFCTYALAGFVHQDGYTLYIWAQGTMVFGLVTVICNLKILIFSNTFTPALIISILFSLISYLISWVVIDNLESAEAYQVMGSLLSTPNFHLGNILIIVLSCSIDIALSTKLNKQLLKPDQEKKASIKKAEKEKEIFAGGTMKQQGGKLIQQKEYTGFVYNCLEVEDPENRERYMI